MLYSVCCILRRRLLFKLLRVKKTKTSSSDTDLTYLKGHLSKKKPYYKYISSTAAAKIIISLAYLKTKNSLFEFNENVKVSIINCCYQSSGTDPKYEKTQQNDQNETILSNRSD